MDDRKPSAAARGRGVILAALVGLGLALCAVAYIYSGDLIDFVQSVASGKPARALGHIRY